MSDTIRLVRDDDATALAAIYGHYVTDLPTSFELEPPDAAEMQRRVQGVTGWAPWLVMCAGDQVRGYAYAARHRERAAYQWSIDVSVYLAPDARGQGIGRALYTSLLAMVRLQGFYAACAGISLPNPASVGLHEAFGFRLVGIYPAIGFKHGAWHDVGWWQLELRPRVITPAPPRSPAELADDPAWIAAISAGVDRSRR